MMGGQNCHAEITFDDNVKWLARFRVRRTTSPPREVRDWILRSEAATMIYLQQNTCIPTPKVFDWACESDSENRLGIGYILMGKLDGKPLDWQAANPQQKEKLIHQLVDIFLEIEKHPFHAMGSLVSSATGSIDVQGLAHQSTFRVGKGALGPFSSSLEGSQAILESYLAMIANGEFDTDFPVDAYLFHRLRRDMIGNLLGDVSPDQFFLKHPDDKGDHILVNGSFEIVGVIDWEWTQTAPKAEAFCSPCLMWPVSEFYNGSNELSADELRLAAVFREKGREDLANCVIDGRKVQRFSFGLGLDGAFLDRETLQHLFKGLQQAFNFEYNGWGPWKSNALERWKDDELLVNLLKYS